MIRRWFGRCSATCSRPTRRSWLPVPRETAIQALARIPDVKPDLVTLDIEMPGMDGLETLVEIRKLYPRLPVIMFSTLTERGAAATLDALARGASDYVTKPPHRARFGVLAGAGAGRIDSEDQVLVRGASAPPKLAAIAPRLPDRPQARIDVVAIGTSTGGPNALTALIPQLPADFPVPIVVVQHMPPLFTRLLAERLNALSRLGCRKARAARRLRRVRSGLRPATST
jgi:two-component system, chemotaxis family, protein-glutamate methylesterase/glutaminase